MLVLHSYALAANWRISQDLVRGKGLVEEELPWAVAEAARYNTHVIRPTCSGNHLIRPTCNGAAILSDRPEAFHGRVLTNRVDVSRALGVIKGGAPVELGVIPSLSQLAANEITSGLTAFLPSLPG
jgi:hypothetical protein